MFPFHRHCTQFGSVNCHVDAFACFSLPVQPFVMLHIIIVLRIFFPNILEGVSGRRGLQGLQEPDAHQRLLEQDEARRQTEGQAHSGKAGPQSSGKSYPSRASGLPLPPQPHESHSEAVLPALKVLKFLVLRPPSLAPCG